MAWIDEPADGDVTGLRPSIVGGCLYLALGTVTYTLDFLVRGNTHFVWCASAPPADFPIAQALLFLRERWITGIACAVAVGLAGSFRLSWTTLLAACAGAAVAAGGMELFLRQDHIRVIYPFAGRSLLGTLAWPPALIAVVGAAGTMGIEYGLRRRTLTASGV